MCGCSVCDRRKRETEHQLCRCCAEFSAPRGMVESFINIDELRKEYYIVFKQYLEYTHEEP